MKSTNTLAWLRSSLGLSQDQMAILFGVNRSTLAHYETGNRNSTQIEGILPVLNALLEARNQLGEEIPAFEPGAEYMGWLGAKEKDVRRQLAAKKVRLEKAKSYLLQIILQKKWWENLQPLTEFNSRNLEYLADSLALEWDTATFQGRMDEYFKLRIEVKILESTLQILIDK